MYGHLESELCCERDRHQLYHVPNRMGGGVRVLMSARNFSHSPSETSETIVTQTGGIATSEAFSRTSHMIERVALGSSWRFPFWFLTRLFFIPSLLLGLLPVVFIDLYHALQEYSNDKLNLIQIELVTSVSSVG